jgi:hypothetical protein
MRSFVAYVQQPQICRYAQRKLQKPMTTIAVVTRY